MIGTLALAAFLAPHAAIHASFLTPAPRTTTAGPRWPSELERSWLLGPLHLEPSAMRAVGAGLVVTVLVPYGAAALSLVGVPPAGLFAMGTFSGPVASLALLVLFFDVWFVAGVGIDLVLLWLVLVRSVPETA